MLDNILDNMTRDFVENDITHLPFWILPYMAKNRDAVYFDNVKYFLLQIFRDVRY